MAKDCSNYYKKTDDEGENYIQNSNNIYEQKQTI